MTDKRKQGKLKSCQAHRQTQYLWAIEKFIDGKVTGEYVTERWQKLKDIKD